MKKEISHRVVTFLDRTELDFLDNLAKDILFTYGVKVPRSTILRTIIDTYVISESEEIKTHQDLVNMILEEHKKGGNDV